MEKKWIAITAILIIMCACVVMSIPVIEVPYTVKEPYTTTETYYEEEPYETTETYYESEPYEDCYYTDYSYSTVSYTMDHECTRQTCTDYDFWGNCIDWKCTAYTFYCIKTVQNNEDRGGTFTFEGSFTTSDGDKIEKGPINIWIPAKLSKTATISYTVPSYYDVAHCSLWVEEAPQKEVCEIHVHDVAKERTVIKYHNVEKQRTVTKYKDVTKYKYISIFEYIR